MRRGDVVRIADKSGDYTSKPGVAVVVQSDLFRDGESVVVCPITHVDAGAPIIRVEIEPAPALTLHQTSWIEIDKITTVRASRTRDGIGRLPDAKIAEVNAALAMFLGLG